MDFLDGVSFTVSLMEKPPPQRGKRGGWKSTVRKKLSSFLRRVVPNASGSSSAWRHCKYLCLFMFVLACLSCAKLCIARAGLTIRGPHTNVRRGPFLVREARIFLSFPKSWRPFLVVVTFKRTLNVQTSKQRRGPIPWYTGTMDNPTLCIAKRYDHWLNKSIVLFPNIIKYKIYSQFCRTFYLEITNSKYVKSYQP